MSFLTKLRFEDNGGLPFTILEPLVYASDTLDRVIEVPSGFKTDLASIPRLLWNILPPFGRYDAAAVIHDYLYATNGVTRGQADSVLREAMDSLDVNALVADVIYAGVRVGGWVPWKRYRRGH